MDAILWERVSQIALGKVANYFKPGEVQTITDFIQTAKQDIPTIIEEINTDGE